MQRVSFSRYLVGHASLERPPFFYGYAVMWLHLLVGSLVLFLFAEVQPLVSVTSVTVGSFCLALVVYGLLAREYGLVINLASYASAMSRVVYPSEMHPLLLTGALLLALISGYHLLAREYRRYNREVFGDPSCGLPAWIGVTIGIVVVLICLFGINLL